MLANRKDNFDIREFLCGELDELPPRPGPAIMTLEGHNFKAVRCR